MRSTVGNYRTENIVTRGLVLHLDAGNPNSYYGPSNSTVWKDLSGNANNGTLVNGVGYNDEAFVFDGVNDYATISSPLFAIGTSNFTLEAWCYRDSSTANLYSGVISSAEVNGDNGIVISDRTCWVGTGSTLQSIGNNSTKNFTDNVWFYVSFRRSNNGKTLSLKINSVDRFTPVTITSPPSIVSPTFNIGQRYNNNYSYEWGGYIAVIKLYTRDLSDTEISQNFNAQRSRFGI